uniref:Uncharacterized protein n=1 Tax=Oryza brachyantha TaxID=4533 RepID=J3MQ34_ORYBR
MFTVYMDCMTSANHYLFQNISSGQPDLKILAYIPSCLAGFSPSIKLSHVHLHVYNYARLNELKI